MLGFLGWFFLALFLYMLSLGIAIFIVSPVVKFGLIHAFEHLPRTGKWLALRQSIAFPVIEILSRERRARRGDTRSLAQLFIFELAATLVVSLLIQGILASVVFTVIFSGAAWWVYKTKL
jgi:hypothetical protein